MKNIIRKILVVLVIMVTVSGSAMAAKLPDDVKNVVKKSFPKANFRFDGIITMPDGTVYLPLLPALVKKPVALTVQKTLPVGKSFADEPDVVILNNDFAFLKVLTDKKGRRTVLYMKEPPIEVKTGLLPQDLLVPRGLIIPDNIKGIIGNLEIPTAQDFGLKIKSDDMLNYRNKKITNTNKDIVSKVPQIDNKTLYVATCYSKNIQVIKGEAQNPQYALAQKAIPFDIKPTPDNKFLLVTNYGKSFVNVISLADDRVIKQIDLAVPAEEILIDAKHYKAYVSSSSDSSVFVIDLSNMILKQKIKLKGACEKLFLSDDGSILFYADKMTNDLWSVELQNEFVTKNIGKFPSVSAIRFTKGKVYVISRVKNRLAVIDYATLGALKELDTEEKPVDMLVYKDNLFILSADKNTVQVIDTLHDELTDTIYLNTDGFSTKIYLIKNSNIAVVTDTKTNKYSVLSLDKKMVIKTNILNVPVSKIEILPNIKKN